MLPADHIAVCICTYQRNELLSRLLRSLAFQKVEQQFRYSVVVVDNDSSGQARETVEEAKARYGYEVSYSVETVRTIPAARNHAVSVAQGNFVALVDDDEFVPADWLLRLYEGIRTFDVDGAVGPVRPYFLEEPPSWLLKSGLCNTPVHRTGTMLHWSQTFTNNALLRREVFDRHGLSFDLSFKTGGSDQEFFRQAMTRGYRFVAVEEAPVYEVFPPSRWTARYWAKRAQVNGFNSARYRRGSSAREGVATIRAATAGAVYGLALPLSACVGRHRFVACLEKASYHISRAAAGIGVEMRRKRDF